MKLTVQIFLSVFLIIGFASHAKATAPKSQSPEAQTEQFLNGIASIKEAQELLFSFKHQKQPTMFVLNDERFRGFFGLKGCDHTYQHGNLPIVVKCIDKLKTESVFFYLEIEEVHIHNHTATVTFKTVGTSPLERHIHGTAHFHRHSEKDKWEMNKSHIKDL